MGKRQVNPFEKQGLKRSVCPVSCVLDILGDKWTLLVVRDMFMGKKTYGELQKSPEKIPTNILAERLKRLEQSGVIEKSQYQERPVRYTYTLTEKGRGLAPVLTAMMSWGNQYVPGTYPADKFKPLFTKQMATQKSAGVKDK